MIGSRRFRSVLAADDGVALLTVVGVMTMVTILAFSAFTLANQSLHEARRAEGESRAFRVAAAGLDSALSSFDRDMANAATEADVSYPTFVTTEGSATVTLHRTDGDAGEYELISLGTAIDGAEERVVQKFYFFNLWEMNFAGTGSQSLMSGSSGMNGSSNIYGPFYVKGNLSLDAFFTVQDGPLFVKSGNLTTTSSATEIGKPDKKVRIYCDRTATLVKGQLYYTGPFRSVPEIELPALTYDDMRSASTLAQMQSVDGRMSRSAENVVTAANKEMEGRAGAIYKFFGDTTSTIDPLGQGSTKVTLGTPSNANGNTGKGSFGSWGAIETTMQVIPARGYSPYATNTHDDFAYWDNPKSNTNATYIAAPSMLIPAGWDLMFISGTIFIDGPLVIDDNVMYIGNGTIVVNGPIILNGKVRPYSYSEASVVVNKVGEDKKWCLGLVTPSTITMNASNSNSGVEPVRDNAFDYAGAFYTDSTLTITRPSVSVRGSILSKKMDLLGTNGDIVTNPLLPTYLPDSLPGGGDGIITPGLWSRG
jgi:hypothetical protein